jgi:hypothetical protein
MNSQALGSRQLGQPAVMVVGQAVGDRLAEVVQEPVGNFGARNDPTSEDW